MQASVLDSHGELCGERDEERPLVGAQRPRLARVDGEEADGLVADDERQRQRGIDPRLGHLRPSRPKPLVRRGVIDLDHAPGLARREGGGEQNRSDGFVRPLDAMTRGDGDAAVILAEIDGDAVGAEHLPEPLERRVESVRERQTSDRLAHDGKQRAAPLELEPGFARPFGRPERVSRADCEARELSKGAFVRSAAGREPELQRTERRLAELKRDELSLAAVALHRNRAVLVEDRLGHALQIRIGLQRAVRAVDLQLAAAKPPETRALGT